KKNSYEGLPNDTRTERELEAIQAVASDFLTLYYQTTTENVDKNLAEIKKLTIDNNSEKYRPGWLTQHASNVLVQEVVSEKYYTDLYAVNGKASLSTDDIEQLRLEQACIRTDLPDASLENFQSEEVYQAYNDLQSLEDQIPDEMEESIAISDKEYQEINDDFLESVSFDETDS